jgi:hypothetical protein
VLIGFRLQPGNLIMTNASAPDDWKTYDDFAAGIATNRLPTTDELIGRTFAISFDDGRRLSLTFPASSRITWSESDQSTTESCDVIRVAPETYFVDFTFAASRFEAETIVLNVRTRRVLSIRARVRDAAEAGSEPRVAQIFRAGVIGEGAEPGSTVPAPTRDLIGLTGHYTYSPHHVYEHIYLSSTRYAWQCLVGVQRGHGDVDLATTYKFADDQYVFTFREFIIPVASTFFYNFRDLRSTGKFLGVTGDGHIANSPAGAFIERISRATYAPGREPV